MAPEAKVRCQSELFQYNKCVTQCKKQWQDPDFLAQVARNTMVMEQLSRGR